MSSEDSSIGVSLARMEGKIDLVTQAMGHAQELAKFDREKTAKLELEVADLKRKDEQRVGAANLAKIVWAVIGGVVTAGTVGIAALIVKLYGA